MGGIRPSRPGDRRRIVAIWRAAVNATHDFLSPQDRAAIDVEAGAYLMSASLWVAVDARDRSIGFMALNEGRLDALFVDPDEDVLVECLPGFCGPDRPAKYAPNSSKAYLLAKLAEAHRVTSAPPPA